MVSEPVTWLAFIQDRETASSFVTLQQDEKKRAIVVEMGGIDEAIHYLQRDNSARHLILDISEVEDPEASINQVSEYCADDTHVIAVGNENNVELYRHLLKMGVDDYLVKPITHQMIFDAFDSVHEAESPPQVTEQAKTEPAIIEKNPLIAILPTAGGLGASTIATNLAYLLAEDKSIKVNLVDFDIYYGNTAVSLGIDTNQGLTEALSNIDRLDDVFLQRLTLDKTQNLSILTAEHDLETAINYTPEAVTALLSMLQKHFDYTIVDIPHGLDLKRNPILKSCERIFLVSDLTLISIRDAARLLKLIKNQAASANVQIIITKSHTKDVSEVTDDQFEKGIGRKIDFQIPYDRAAVVAAINTGVPIIEEERDNKIVTTLKTIVYKITEREEEEELPWYKEILNKLTK